MITDDADVVRVGRRAAFLLGQIVLNSVRQSASCLAAFEDRGIFVVDKFSLAHGKDLVFHVSLILDDAADFLSAAKSQITCDAGVIQV